jgi:hypothetical protein
MTNSVDRNSASPPIYPLRVVEKLRNYDTCHDGDIDEAATLIEHMHGLLRRVYDQCGNDQPPVRRHALTPATRDSIRDLLYG